MIVYDYKMHMLFIKHTALHSVIECIFFSAAQVVNGQKMKSLESGDVSIASQSSKEVYYYLYKLSFKSSDS